MSGGGDTLSYDNRVSAPGSIPFMSKVPFFCSSEIEQASREAEKTGPAAKPELAAETANKGIKIDQNPRSLKHRSRTSCTEGKLSAEPAVGGADGAVPC